MNVLVKNHAHFVLVLVGLYLQNVVFAKSIADPLTIIPSKYKFLSEFVPEHPKDTILPSSQNTTTLAGCGVKSKVNAPTNPKIDDTRNSLDWDYVPGYESATLYEFTLDGGTLYQQVAKKPQLIPDHNFEIGQVGIRLKSGSNHYASVTLFNPIPLTAGAIQENLLSFSENFDKTSSNRIWETLAGGYTKASSALNPLSQPVSYQYFVNGDAAGSGRLVTKYSVVPDVVYTFSIYVKYENLNSLRIQMLGGEDNQWAIFNVKEGSVLSKGTGCTARIIKSTNDWYRASVTFVPTKSINNGHISISTPEPVTGDYSRRYLLFGAQLNRGNAPATYIKTP